MSDNSFTFLLTLIGYIFGAGGWLTFFFERRKNKAAADLAMINAIKGLQEVYRTVIEDAGNALTKVPELERKINEQAEEINMLTDIITKQREACENCEILSKKRKP